MSTTARDRLALRFSVLCLLSALPMAGIANEWFTRVWQTEDGLPGGTVTGVAQTRDGYLWIATVFGLARFDGVRVQKMPIPVGRPYPIIRALLRDRGDRLWLSEPNGALARVAPGQYALFTAESGLSKAQVTGLAQAGDGAVWIASADGMLCRLSGEQVTRFGKEQGLPDSGVASLAADAEGVLWLAKAGAVGTLREARFELLFTGNARDLVLGTARGKGVWVAAGNQLFKVDSESRDLGPPLAMLTAEAPAIHPTVVFEDASGAVWVGSAAHGLFRAFGASVSRMETSHAGIMAVVQDREANIWVGTEGGGLNRVRPPVVELQGRAAGLPFDTVGSACEDLAGTVWLVLGNGALANNEGGVWRTVSSAANWPGGEAACVTCDSRGDVWIGTYGQGLLRWRDGRYTVILPRDGLAAENIKGLLADRKGNLWILFSSENQLQRFHDGQFQNYTLPAESQTPRTMTEDAAGVLWLGNVAGQLFKMEGGRVVNATPREAKAVHPIRGLTATPDGSVWIAYWQAGLGRFKDGRLSTLGAGQGLYEDNLCSLCDDDRGWMWFASDHGIFRASLFELNEVLDGKRPKVKSFAYGKDEGLPSLEGSFGNSPNVARFRDGRLALLTHRGLALAHPNRLQPSLLALPAVVESVLVDGHELPATGAEEPELSPAHSNIQIRFTAPAFSEPENVCFRYRLEGFDKAWIEAGRQRHAAYAQLPPGRYQFQVTACNSVGVWNETGATFAFVVQPFFWQTAWFWFAFVALVVGIALGFVRYAAFWRLRQQVRLLAREAALSKERTRIARDIHDDLGASLTQISLLGELACQDIQQPARASEHVVKLATLARQAIAALDEIVWAVNPRNDTLAHLLDYLAQFATDFLSAAGVRCRLDLPAQPPACSLSAEMRHTLYLVVREALNNTVKHARASEVRLRARVANGALRLIVRDNGRGFDAAPDSPHADGLRNMQQRLAEVGGRFQFKAGRRPAH